MVTAVRAVAPRATLPWTHAPKGGKGAGYPGGEEYLGRFLATTELHERRTTEQLEAILAERLAELRGDPPRGYPK